VPGAFFSDITGPASSSSASRHSRGRFTALALISMYPLAFENGRRTSTEALMGNF
jgi:hypothetical protein